MKRASPIPISKIEKISRRLSTKIDDKQSRVIDVSAIGNKGHNKKQKKTNDAKIGFDGKAIDFTIPRCPWVKNSTPLLFIHYHDNEWGVPFGLNIGNDNFKERDEVDRKHFELISLGGAQAGLSWSTILRRREHYRKAFDNFYPKIVSQYDEKKIEELVNNPDIIRNRLKIQSVVHNAKKFLLVQEKHGSFNNYIWSFMPTPFTPIANCKNIKDLESFPARSELSDKIAKDMKNLGFKFTGSLIIYAYLQSAGIINDHSHNCFRAAN